MKKQWIINLLERTRDNGFVFNVHWSYVFTENGQNGKTYYADSYSVINYEYNPEDTDFIPYEDLTEEIVISWVKDELGQEAIDAMEVELFSKIEEQKNSPTLAGIPWV